MTKEDLIEQLKGELIEALDLEDTLPENFNADTPIFVGGLGLDSIDALEIIVLLERKYGKKIEDPKARRVLLYSLNTIAAFVHGELTIEDALNKADKLEMPDGRMKIPDNIKDQMQ